MKTGRFASTVSLAACAMALVMAGGCAETRSNSAASSDAAPLFRPSAIKPTNGDQVQLADIRQATARFQNIDVARAAGYVDDGYGCIDATTFGLDPSVGGMGFHLINDALHANPETDPLRPDLLVYEPAHGSGMPKLVALEYEVFKSDWYAAHGQGAAPPTLLGQPFVSIDLDDLHVFGLHLWLWAENPSGAFADFNPRVSCH